LIATRHPRGTTPLIRELFAGFAIERLMVARSINSDGAGRGRVGEVLVRNYEIARADEANHGQRATHDLGFLS